MTELTKLTELTEFNQFKQSGIAKSTYDESLYTSSLDQSKITAKQREDALRVEKEINSTQSQNRHIQEERGQVELTDDAFGEQRNNRDEEMAFSGVIRDQGKKEVVSFSKFKCYRTEIKRNALDQMKTKFIRDVSDENKQFVVD